MKSMDEDYMTPEQLIAKIKQMTGPVSLKPHHPTAPRTFSSITAKRVYELIKEYESESAGNNSLNGGSHP
jgi:hypothetical protein